MHESSCEVAGFLKIIGLLFQFLLNHAAACLIESKQFDLFADVEFLLGQKFGDVGRNLVDLLLGRLLGLALAHRGLAVG